MITSVLCVALGNFAVDIAYLRDKGYDEQVVARLVMDVPAVDPNVAEAIQIIIRNTYDQPDITPEENGNLVMDACKVSE